MAGWLECSRERKRYYTWLEIDKRLSRVVPELRRFAPDVIVAIGGGGFIPARVLRSSLKVPIVAVSLELYDASDAIGQEVTVRQWFDGTDSTAALVRGKRVLVVDEVDDSRTTLQFASEGAMGNLINKLLCMPENEGSSKNMAFVFIKPHAVTEATKKLVAEVLAAKGLTILEQGELTAEEIDKKRLIDQHYYAIASKATILKPAQLNVPADKFKAKFGDDWQVQLDAGKVLNASDACAKYGLSAEELGKVWDVASAKKLLVKFGGGFYCAKLTFGTKKKETAYVFNGFFMRMRNKFTAPGKRIHYYVVSWEAEKLSWKDFRGKLLGPTDPAKAPSGSLRAEIYSRWQELGLSRAPDVGDNGVHASASPFEGLCERMNWLATPTAKDPYGMYLLDKGITEATISAWSYDPQVLYLDGGQGSVWDVLEDLDSEPLCEKALALAQANSALPIP